MQGSGYNQFSDEPGASSSVVQSRLKESTKTDSKIIPMGRKPLRDRNRTSQIQGKGESKVDDDLEKLENKRKELQKPKDPEDEEMDFPLNKSLYCFIVKVLAQKSSDNDWIFVIRSLVATLLMFVSQTMLMIFIQVEVGKEDSKPIKSGEEFKHFCRFVILFLLYCIISVEMKQAIDLMVVSYTANAKKFMVHGSIIGVMQYFISFFVMLTSAMLITQTDSVMNMVLNFSALIIVTSMDDMIAEHIGLLVGEDIEDDFYKLTIKKREQPNKFKHWKVLRGVLFFGPLLFLMILFILGCLNINL